MRLFVLLPAFICLSFFAQAQEKVQVSTDSGKQFIPIKSYANRFKPRRALLLSAIIPGAGQIYTKKYWKVPIVYGGLWFGYYMIKTSYDFEYEYRNQLFDLLSRRYVDASVTVAANGATEEQLRSAINTARRNRDLWIVLTGLWYLLQIIDAHVDAHLKEFKLNPRLRMTLCPAILQTPGMLLPVAGATASLKF